MLCGYVVVGKIRGEQYNSIGKEDRRGDISKLQLKIVPENLYINQQNPSTGSSL